MTVDELESLLATIAAQRKKVLADRRHQTVGTPLQRGYSRSSTGLFEQEFRLLQQKVDLLLAHAQLNATANAYPNPNPAGATVQLYQPQLDRSVAEKVPTALEESPAALQETVPDPTPEPGTMVVTPGRQLLVGRTVYFAHNSSRLSAADRELIAQLVPTIQQHQQTVLVVLRGYASQVGNAFYNNQLSFERADAIKQELLQRGVSPANIMIFYHGADPTLAAAEARRVDIILEVLPLAEP